MLQRRKRRYIYKRRKTDRILEAAVLVFVLPAQKSDHFCFDECVMRGISSSGVHNDGIDYRNILQVGTDRLRLKTKHYVSNSAVPSNRSLIAGDLPAFLHNTLYAVFIYSTSVTIDSFSEYLKVIPSTTLRGIAAHFADTCFGARSCWQPTGASTSPPLSTAATSTIAPSTGCVKAGEPTRGAAAASAPRPAR